MIALRLSARAEQDLREIYAYTHAHWDRTQADEYLAEIESGFLALMQFPQAGRKRDDLRPALRALVKAHHVIYYVVEAETVDILGVLHERMDPEAVF